MIRAIELIIELQRCDPTAYVYLETAEGSKSLGKVKKADQNEVVLGI